MFEFTKEDKFIIFYNTFLFIVTFVLILSPHSTRRKIRHALMPINMKMWSKEGLIHAIIHDFLWQRGNGH